MDVSSVAWTLSAWNASTGLFLQRDSMESIGCGLKSEYEYQAVKAYVWKHGEYMIHSVSALLGEVGWVGMQCGRLWTFADMIWTFLAFAGEGGRCVPVSCDLAVSRVRRRQGRPGSRNQLRRRRVHPVPAPTVAHVGDCSHCSQGNVHI